MKGNFIKWLLAAIWFLPACTEVIELEFPKHRPLLVVNSVINPRDTVNVQVSLSKSLNDDSFYPLLDNAVVHLFKDGVFLEQLTSKGKGNYTTASRPEAGAAYTLKVNAPGYHEAQASVTIPEVQDVSITNIKYIQDTENRTAFGRWIQVTALIADNPSTEDKYFVRAYSVDSSYYASRGKLFTRYRSIQFPVAINETGFSGMQMFTDITFKGEQHQFTFNVEYSNGRETIIQIGKLSPEFFEYTRTYNGQSNYDENLFSQPNAVSNNIKGGLGIFGAFNARSYVLKNGQSGDEQYCSCIHVSSVRSCIK